MDPSTKLVLDEMRRLFAEHNAYLDRRFAEHNASIAPTPASSAAISVATAPAPSAAASVMPAAAPPAAAACISPAPVLSAAACVTPATAPAPYASACVAPRAISLELAETAAVSRILAAQPGPLRCVRFHSDVAGFSPPLSAVPAGPLHPALRTIAAALPVPVPAPLPRQILYSPGVAGGGGGAGGPIRQSRMDEGCTAAEDIAVYLGHDDCLHNDGQPLLGGETISFEYANAFPSELSVRVATCIDPTMPTTFRSASISIQAQMVFDKMPRRYNTIVYPPHSNGVAAFGPVSVVQEAPEVFEEMAKHILEILWPPPMHMSNMLCTACVPSVQSLVDKSIQSCFSPPSCRSWDAVPHRQPWPPPEQFGMQGNGVQLRSSPWPSFIGITVQVADLIKWLCCNSECTVAGPLLRLHVRMLVMNWDCICFKVHLPLPACVCGTVRNMNFLLHDGASILLAPVTESTWFQLFGKATQHSSCAADFLGVFELSVSNTVLGGLLLNTHQLCFSQFWQLTEPSLPHKYFKWEIIERVVQCGQHCHELLKPAGQVDKFNKELLTCILVLSVSMVGYALIPELVQRKCGGKCQCFLLEGNRLRDIGEAFECLVLFQHQPGPPPLLLLLLSDMHILILLPWLFFSMVDGYWMIWYFCFPWKPPWTWTPQCLPSVRQVISGGGDVGVVTRKLSYSYQTAVVAGQGFKPWNEISVHVMVMTTLKPVDQSSEHVPRLLRELIIVKLIDGTPVRILELVDRSSGHGIPWVLFLAIASVYGYWNLQCILALFSLYWPVTFDKEVGLGCLIWNIHMSRVVECLYHDLFGTPLFICMKAKDYSRKNMHSPAAALIAKLLKDASAECLVSSSQMMKGFYRVAESLAAIILAIPSAKLAKSKPIVTHAVAPHALPKDTRRQLSKKELKKHMIVQFSWDPCGSDLLHRLGGKPKLKKGGMSGITHGWAIIWVMGLGLGIIEHWPGCQALAWTTGRHLQERRSTSWKRSSNNRRQTGFLPLESSLCPLFIFLLNP